jgi:hypothetical protein
MLYTVANFCSLRNISHLRGSANQSLAHHRARSDCSSHCRVAASTSACCLITRTSSNATLLCIQCATQQGPFTMAKRAGVRIVPVSLVNTHVMMPPDCLMPVGIPRNVEIRLHPAISTEVSSLLTRHYSTTVTISCHFSWHFELQAVALVCVLDSAIMCTLKELLCTLCALRMRC